MNNKLKSEAGKEVEKKPAKFLKTSKKRETQYKFWNKGLIILCIVGLMLINIPYNNAVDLLEEEYLNYSTNKYAEYFFDEGAGNIAVDDSGKLNDGIIYNPLWVNGKDFMNNALQFNGNSYVDIPNSPDFEFGFDDDYMIYIVFKTSHTGYMPLITHYDFENIYYPANGYELCIDSQGYPYFELYGTYIHASSMFSYQKVNDGQWHFVAVIYSNRNLTMYVDPSQNSNGIVCSREVESMPNPPTSSVVIGAAKQGGGLPMDYFNGVIDDVHFMVPSKDLIWEYQNQGYYTFDEIEFQPPGFTRYINDRHTWGYEDRGYMNENGGFSTASRYGVSCAAFINGLGIQDSWACVPDHEDSLDLNNRNYYIDMWFNIGEEFSNYNTLLFKRDFTPLPNGYHIYLDSVLGLDYFRYARLHFKIINNGQEYNFCSQDYNIRSSTWNHLMIKSESGILRIIVESISGENLVDFITDNELYPGPTTEDLYIANWDATQLIQKPTYEKWGFDGLIDELKLGIISPRTIYETFDNKPGYLNDRDIVLGRGDDFTEPIQNGNTPWGKTYYYDGIEDQLSLCLHPFCSPRDESFTMGVSIFPYKYKDLNWIIDKENYVPEKMIIATYGFWTLYIDNDENLCFEVKSFVNPGINYYIGTATNINYYEWNDIRITYNSYKFDLYLNNVISGTTVISAGDPFYYLPDPSSKTFIDFGNGYYRQETVKHGFIGYIDEFYYNNLIINNYFKDKMISTHSHNGNIISYDFDEGSGFIANNNGNSEEYDGYLGLSHMGRAKNLPTSSYNNRRIYDNGIPDYIDSTVTISAGKNNGVTKNIAEVDIDNKYLDVGVGNEYSEDIDDRTIYYIQKDNPTWSENGIYGRCVSFNNDVDTRQYILTSSPDMEYSDRLMISFWFKPSSVNDCFIAGMWSSRPTTNGQGNQDGLFWIEMVNSKISFILCGQDPQDPLSGITHIFNTNYVINSQSWHHIRFIYFDKHVYYYVNGDFHQSFMTTFDTLDSTTQHLYIGCHQSALSSTGYNGLLDQFEFGQDKFVIGIPIQHFDFENIGGTIEDTSIKQINAVNYGVSQTTGIIGNGALFESGDYIEGTCPFYGSYTVETWIKISDYPQCISVFSYEDNQQNSYPVIFSVNNVGLLELRFSSTQYMMGTEMIHTNSWVHVGYSVNSGSYDNLYLDSRENSVTMFVNGKPSYTYYDIQMESRSPGSTHKYLIGKNDNLWNQPTMNFEGLMDEFVIKSYADDFRNDEDGDRMPNGYEILRLSSFSNQFDPYDHNYRIAVMFAPIFGGITEPQFAYDIFFMQVNLKALNYNNENILYMAPKIAEVNDFYGDFLGDNEIIDGEPRKDCLNIVFDGLKNGGPVDIYTMSGTDITDRFHFVPKLGERDLLFFEFRDHGCGYKDNVLPNGEGQYKEWDYGWRGGRLQSVDLENGIYYNMEEEETRGEITEQEFVLNIKRYIPLINQFSGIDGDPDIFYKEETFITSANYQDPYPPYSILPYTRTRWLIDLNFNEYPEEIYLVQEYSEPIVHNPLVASKTSSRYWLRLYIDGYDFSQVVVNNSVAISGYATNDTNNNGRDTMWDAQVLLWDDGNYQGTDMRLDLVGLDLNQDNLIHYFGGDSFESYISILEDDIDIDEGMACYYDVKEEDGIPQLEEGNEEDSLESNTIKVLSYFSQVIWDDELAEKFEALNYKDLICVIDCCYSGGFINDLESLASAILTSSIETDTSYRFNVMFYSRFKGDNIASFFNGVNILKENRDNEGNVDRYLGKYINADGAKELNLNPTYSQSQNNDRDIIWDLNSWIRLDKALEDQIISFNEAAIFVDAITADAYDETDGGVNRKHQTSQFSWSMYWKHDPVTYFVNGYEEQFYL